MRTQQTQRLLAAVLCGALAACGGAGSVSGSVAGSGVTVHDAIATLSAGPLVTIFISDEPNICANALTSQRVHDSTTLTLVLGHSLGKDFATGDYEIVQDITQLLSANKLLASASFNKTGATCQDQLTASASLATAGKVTVTGIDLKAGGKTEGHFDLAIGTQADRLTGSFSAQFCDLSNKTGTNVCQ
jgi:hypothetical protein